MAPLDAEVAKGGDGASLTDGHRRPRLYRAEILTPNTLVQISAAATPRYLAEKLPLYLGFFKFVHNARRQGKALLGALIAALVM